MALGHTTIMVKKKTGKALGPASGSNILASAGIEANVDAPIAINKWDIAAVKNLMDDAVYKYVLDFSEGFEEDYLETDIRLTVCLLACLFAGFACIWGFFVPHPESTTVVGSCVIGYFSLVTLLSIYQSFFEVPTLLYAKKKNDNGKSDELHVVTFMERYNTKYEVHITYTRASTGEKLSHQAVWDINDYFYEDGVLANENVDEDVRKLCEDCVSKSKKIA